MIFRLTLIALSFFMIACTTTLPKQQEEDFDRIKKEKKLTVLTVNTSTSYFIYRDEPMGYYYDLCKGFCELYGLELEIKVAKNVPELLEMLARKEGDLVAYGFPVEASLKDSLIYCGLEQTSYQVLVQRLTPRDSLIRDVADLIGREVYVASNTKYQDRIQNLNEELGGGILVQEVSKDSLVAEDLIAMVSSKEIDFTVCDENVARLNRTYYKNLDISTSISFKQRSSWVVRKDMPKLAQALNEWFDSKQEKAIYSSIMKKYFELSKQPLDEVASVAIPKGALSPFDGLFKKHAGQFDWRLLVAIAYQESKFRTDLSSWAGAVGLMGLMPRTAVSLGISVEDRTDPDLSIQASVKYLIKLDKLFRKIDNADERIKFILAAYNGGLGHILDAQNLARKYGSDPYVWEGHVKEYVILKRNPEYYNDPVCKSGYFRGTETLNYVDKVFDNWQKYKGHTI